MSGFSILLRKELAESWATRRLPVVAGLFVVVGMLSPLTARYLPEILRATLGDQLPMALPTPTAVDAVAQLQKNLAQIGALVAIALAMGSVSGELDRGTAALVLAQPVTRPAFLAAKLTSIGLVLLLATFLAAVAAWVYTAVLFAPPPIGGWLAMTVLSWLALTAWAALTFLASAATGLDDGGRGHRVRGPDRRVAGRDRARARPAAADRARQAGDPARGRRARRLSTAAAC